MRKIEFRINKDGSDVKTEADGFKGKGCLEKTDQIMEGLSAGVSDQELKADFNQEELVDIGI